MHYFTVLVWRNLIWHWIPSFFMLHLTDKLRYRTETSILKCLKGSCSWGKFNGSMLFWCFCWWILFLQITSKAVDNALSGFFSTAMIEGLAEASWMKRQILVSVCQKQRAGKNIFSWSSTIKQKEIHHKRNSWWETDSFTSTSYTVLIRVMIKDTVRCLHSRQHRNIQSDLSLHLTQCNKLSLQSLGKVKRHLANTENKINSMEAGESVCPISKLFLYSYIQYIKKAQIWVLAVTTYHKHKTQMDTK